MGATDTFLTISVITILLFVGFQLLGSRIRFAISEIALKTLKAIYSLFNLYLIISAIALAGIMIPIPFAWFKGKSFLQSFYDTYSAPWALEIILFIFGLFAILWLIANNDELINGNNPTNRKLKYLTERYKHKSSPSSYLRFELTYYEDKASELDKILQEYSCLVQIEGYIKDSRRKKLSKAIDKLKNKNSSEIKAEIGYIKMAIPDLYNSIDSMELDHHEQIIKNYVTKEENRISPKSMNLKELATELKQTDLIK